MKIEINNTHEYKITYTIGDIEYEERLTMNADDFTYVRWCRDIENQAKSRQLAFERQNKLKKLLN